MRGIVPIVLGMSLLVGINPVHALEPDEILVLSNRNVPASQQLAMHYLQARNVPAANHLPLDVPTVEDVSLAQYQSNLVAPIRAKLKDLPKIRCLLLMYGLPLRVGATPIDAATQTQVAMLQRDLDQVRNQLEAAKKANEMATVADLQKKEQQYRQQIGQLSMRESVASVDSELMLVHWDQYPRNRWVINPLYWQLPVSEQTKAKPILMTCRLDGPTVEIVRRCIDQAIAVERTGLAGKVYVDARGIRYDAKSDTGGGYGGYDESMREMAALLKSTGKLDVILNDKPELFTPESCPECALYCGWYSHAQFIDSNRFVPGAIAWHLASSEAVSLKRVGAKYWCKNLLEKGAIATLGPVAEPYTIGFPKPAEFFGMLATGKVCLVEAYARTTLLTSWMGVLVGDPLYRPFAKNPIVEESAVKASPVGGQPLTPRRR
ncbi:TIGR03790 family protein [Tuwongella immobilis]|uniref:Marine sediment metagenome DNA, contig: S01H1_L05325 n=1 Tax=Tuwongella immobilis TaxID=692036 RepID=A0A6C2YIG1_9BACT